MGHSRDDASVFASYTTSTRSARMKDGTFGSGDLRGMYDTTSSSAKKDYDPAFIDLRESRTSVANPLPTPVILGLDGTGSMGSVLESAVVNIGTLMKEINERKPVTDPHIMGMVLQDVLFDPMPLQATQFEASLVVVEQFKEIVIRMGGGSNNSESYHLPLHFAHTRCDCDSYGTGRKGFIFTIGDELIPPPLTEADLRKVYGVNKPIDGPFSYEELVVALSDNWHVFHIMVEQGSFMRSRRQLVIDTWTKALGQNAIPLGDIDKLAEVIVAAMQVTSGADADAVVASFGDAGTSLVVAAAIKGLTPAGVGGTGGVVRL